MEKLAVAAQLLRNPDPTNVLAALRIWVARTPISLVRSAILGLEDYDDRERVASATLDLLSSWPNTVFGVPSLLYFRSEEPHLPEPQGEHPFVPLRTLVVGPHVQASAQLYANRVQAAILRVPGQFESAPTVEEGWIQSVFPDLPPSSTLQFSGSRSFAWPAAVEAAMVLHAGAQTGQPVPLEKCVWLQPSEWQYAVDAGRLFRDASRAVATK